MSDDESASEADLRYRVRLAAAITDLFEARRILTRSRLGYPQEYLKSTYFHTAVSEDAAKPDLNVVVHRSRLKQSIISICGNSPYVLRGLIGTARRVRGAVTVAKLIAEYPRSKRRLEIKIQIRDVLAIEFPELLALIRARRALYRVMRVRNVLPSPASTAPYNLQHFRARETATLYLYDLLNDASMSEEFHRMLDRMLDHAASYGRFEACLALNFYAGGGAENAGLNYLHHYSIRSVGSVILVLTDVGHRKALPSLPKNVFLLDIEKFRGAHTSEKRQCILFNTLIALRPSLFHIVNSEVAWALLHRMPVRFVSNMKVISSNFALQFADPRRRNVVGYAAANLPNCIAKLDAVVTDNRCFATQGIETLGLGSHQDKMHVVYNACNLDECVSSQDAELLLLARIKDLHQSSRLKVIWAGRIDEEKRIDILLDAARFCQDFCDFHVYGSPVVSSEMPEFEALQKQGNVILEGPFSSPLEWEKNDIKHVFFFTSRWEGMPNVLVEAAYLGMPVCAMNVGGVSELIEENTGWLIEEECAAEDLATILNGMLANLQEVERRTRALIGLVRFQHSRDAYATQMDGLLKNLAVFQLNVDRGESRINISTVNV